jgi:SAM-dependent methyltransferase
LKEGHDINRWILERNGFASNAELKAYLRSKRRILDAGCGNGRVTALLRTCSSVEKTEIVAVDLVAAKVARRNLSRYRNIKVQEANLLGDLSGLGKFDFIYCQEVLHHTADPPYAFRNLCSLLLPGGEIAVYLYKRKGPAREFVDAYIHKQISNMPYPEAMKVCEQLTALGKALSGYKMTLEIPDVETLNITSGRYDLQRFIYHFFCKCFWNPSLSFQENAVINYDWYHPDMASRHTLEEIRGWFSDVGLTVVHEYVDHYGITVRGRRS